MGIRSRDVLCGRVRGWVAWFVLVGAWCSWFVLVGPCRARALLVVSTSARARAVCGWRVRDFGVPVFLVVCLCACGAVAMVVGRSVFFGACCVRCRLWCCVTASVVVVCHLADRC